MIAATFAGALGGELASPSADSPAWSTARSELVTPSALASSCWTSVSEGAPVVGAGAAGGPAFCGRAAPRLPRGSAGGAGLLRASRLALARRQLRRDGEDVRLGLLARRRRGVLLAAAPRDQ